MRGTTTGTRWNFLPAVLAGFYLLGRWSQGWAAAWLFAASVFFYGWWMPEFMFASAATVSYRDWAYYGKCGICRRVE